MMKDRTASAIEIVLAVAIAAMVGGYLVLVMIDVWNARELLW